MAPIILIKECSQFALERNKQKTFIHRKRMASCLRFKFKTVQHDVEDFGALAWQYLQYEAPLSDIAGKISIPDCYAYYLTMKKTR